MWQFFVKETIIYICIYILFLIRTNCSFPTGVKTQFASFFVYICIYTIYVLRIYTYILILFITLCVELHGDHNNFFIHSYLIAKIKVTTVMTVIQLIPFCVAKLQPSSLQLQYWTNTLKVPALFTHSTPSFSSGSQPHPRM